MSPDALAAERLPACRDALADAMGESSKTPLYHLLREAGGKFVDFAGYQLPLQFAGRGFMAEHLWCRSKAALFDVSHMCQVRARAPRGQLDGIFPVAPSSLEIGQNRYTQLLNPLGGTVDDLLIANDGEHLFAVFNAAQREVALQAVAEGAPGARVEVVRDHALVAIQGPRAAAALAAVLPEAARLGFMRSAWMQFEGGPCRVSRSGYTGEDGFEVSVPAARAEALCTRLSAHPDVGYAGLGARDSLRLEAGLCLYGQELDASTTPVEAGLAWSIPKSRRVAGTFTGAARIIDQIEKGTQKTLVGLDVLGKAPVRRGAALRDGTRQVGVVTSGVYSPTLQRPIAMGYVPPGCAATGYRLYSEVRGRRVECAVAELPFCAHNYRRKGGRNG